MTRAWSPRRQQRHQLEWGVQAGGRQQGPEWWTHKPAAAGAGRGSEGDKGSYVRPRPVWVPGPQDDTDWGSATNMITLNSRDQRVDPSGGAACLETTDHAGRGPCGPSASVNATHLSSSPGRKPLGLSTQYCRQPSHMGGRQPWGYGAFRWLLRLHPAPQDTATTLGKQPRKSSGNTNPPPGSSRSPGARHPPTPHPPAQGGRASTAWFALARPRGHCGSFPGFPAASPITQPVLPKGTWGTGLEPLPPSAPTL